MEDSRHQLTRARTTNPVSAQVYAVSGASCSLVDRRWALRSILETLLARYAAMPVHCCHKPGSSKHARLEGTVSSGTAIKPDVIWKTGQESPRFCIDVFSAIEFVRAALHSAVGTCIIHKRQLPLRITRLTL
eukprot:6203748-Pleurochrysis_carterae.AAC.10